jgi:hypothetical protein
MKIDRYTVGPMALLLSITFMGCGGGKQLSDAERIIGKWDNYHSIEFLSNGEYREYAPEKTYTGKWRMLSDHRIEVKTDGLFLGTNEELTYEFSGERLVLKGVTDNRITRAMDRSD